jgi:acetylcholinesterase
MHSGATLSVGPITDGQVYYDNIVAQTNCSDASDTLDCLRKAPYDKLKAAFDSIPDLFSYQVRRCKFRIWGKT